MATWNTPEQYAEYARQRDEQKVLWDKWKSGELYAERQAERKREEALRRERERERERKIYPSVWHNGEEYFSMRQLAILRGASPRATREWAKRRPSLCGWFKGHMYCRHVASPSEVITPAISHDGAVYFSMPELARRHEISRPGAYYWAVDHPELTIRHNGRLYARDEGYRPRFAPPSISRDGEEWLTVRELARRRGIRCDSAREWAMRHPEATRIVRGHLFVRDLVYAGKKIPPVIWKGPIPYYSMAELARRRGLKMESVQQWTARHPHLAIKVKGYWYARDEEWKSRKPGYVPPPGPPAEVMPYLWARAVRTRKASPPPPKPPPPLRLPRVRPYSWP